MMQLPVQLRPCQRIRILKQPHTELGFENAQHSLIENGSVRLSLCKESLQFLMVADRDWQFHIHSRFHTAQSCLLPALGRALYRTDILHGTVIGKDNSLKSHFLPKQACQIFF